MPTPLHILIVLFTGLWFIVRWTSRLSARALVWLYQTWRQRSEPMESSTHRIIYTGKWLLADDHQCSGRAVVLKYRHNYKPGVELQYFGEETPQAFYGERYMDSEDEAVDTALAMHQKLLRNVRQRSKPERMPAVVTTCSEITTGYFCLSGDGNESASLWQQFYLRYENDVIHISLTD